MDCGCIFALNQVPRFRRPVVTGADADPILQGTIICRLGLFLDGLPSQKAHQQTANPVLHDLLISGIPSVRSTASMGRLARRRRHDTGARRNHAISVRRRIGNLADSGLSPRRRSVLQRAKIARRLQSGGRSFLPHKTAQPSCMFAIETSQLTKGYGSRRGVDEVSFSVGAGEIFGFLGPNGAGKSTTIRLLLGFLKASAGQATILGQDCWHDTAAIKQDVGYVAGDVRLYPWLTTRRAFQIVGDVRGVDLHSHGLELAERFQLEPDLPVRKMSRGNRQKVALVLALAHRPKLVILDEPTSGLDPLMQDTLADCLRQLAKEGHTVFFSSHTLSEVDSLCDRVAIVKNGRIVADESLATMKARAPRAVSITFASEADAQAAVVPQFAMSTECVGNQLKLQLTGSAAELAQWSATVPMTDISIGQPNLETLFRSFYDTSATEQQA